MSFFPLSRRYAVSRSICLVAAVAAIVLDQVTKMLSVAFLKNAEPFVLINGVLRLTYVENRGAAFGSFADDRWVFMLISTVAIVLILACIIFGKKLPTLQLAALTMVLSGGIGNMIDRIALGYVVDMIDVYLIRFAVFNVADCFVTVGCFLLIFVLLYEFVQELKRKPAE